jgi:hypothetical protein
MYIYYICTNKYTYYGILKEIVINIQVSILVVFTGNNSLKSHHLILLTDIVLFSDFNIGYYFWW